MAVEVLAENRIKLSLFSGNGAIRGHEILERHQNLG